MKARKATVGAAACVLAAALSVVSAGQARPTQSVTVTMMGFAGIRPAQQIMIDNFHRAHPDIKVEPTWIDGGTAFTTLLPQLQAGNAPDILTINLGNTTPAAVWPLAKDKRLLDLKIGRA